MSSSTSVAKNDVKQVIQMMNDNEIILTKSLPASVQGSMFVKLVPATFFNELLKWSEMNNSDVGIDSVINVYIDSMKALVTPESYNAFVLSSSSNDSSSSRKSTSSKQQANNNNKLSIIPDSLELLYNEEIENNFKIVTTDVGEMLEKCLSSLISSSSSSKTNNNNNPSIKFLRRWLHVSSDKDKFVVEFWPFVLNVSLSTGVSNNTEQIIPVFSILVSHISPIKHIPNLLRNSLVLVTDVKSSSKNVFFENDIIKSSAAADRNEMRVWMKTCSNDDNNNNDDEEKKNVGNSNGNGEPIKKNSIAEEWQLLVETGEADNDEEDSEDGPETVKDALLTANNIKPIAGDHPGRVLFYFLLEKKLANGKWPRADATDPDNAAESKPRPVASKSSRAHTMSFSAANPQVGQEVDVQRLKDDKWYESRIVSVETKAEGLFVTVHFLSFPSSDDEVFHCLSDRLRPRNTKVPNWRSQLRIEEEIDINKSQVFKDEGSSTISRGIRFIRFRVGRGGGLKAEEPAEWVLGTVKKVDFSNQKRVLVRIKFGSMWNQGKEEWVPLDSEYIAPKYTHTPKPVQTTSSPSIPGKPQVQGIVGLRNLGNTCFMNSMLQCLSSTIPLTNYFISGEYSDHINLKNALGAGGQLAITYAGVMDEMWNGSFTTVVPVEFKRVLGIFAPQFQGYAQQDSHEFLSLLMDGLHEDLNKIQKKPATEPVESKGKTDPVVANESWEVFKKRNDSFIVDNLMGMMRSHLTCPKCKTEATKFDPYSNISLPIPSSQLEKYEIVFVGFSSASPKDSSKGIRQLIATRYTVFVPKRSSAKALASWLESELKISASDMILTTLSNNKFFPSMIMYQDPDVDVGLPTHSEDDIIAIQLDSISSIIEAQKEYTKVLNARLATSSKMKTRAKKAKKKLKKKRAAQWENIERMFRTLSKPSEIIDAWLEMGPPENDLQIELVQRLSNITLDFEGGSYLPQAVAKYAIGKVKSFELDISPALSHWATNELMLKDLTPESVSPSIPNQNEDDDPSNGRRNSAQGNKDDAQYVLIPIQFQVEGIKYTSFRAMHVIRILRNSTHSEVHKCIWQHVRSIFNPDFKPSQSFMQTVDPSLRPVDSNDNDSDDDDDDSGSGYDVKDFPYLIKSSGYSQESNFPFNDELVNWPSQSMAMQEGLTVMLLKDGIENLLEGISVTSSSGNGYNRRMGGEISFDDRNRRMNLGTVNLHLSFTKIHKGDANSSDSDDGVTTLKQCFEKFRLREQLSEHDEWYCPTCKEHVQAFKKMDLWDAPDVLIVHLKRFLYETRGRFSVYGGSAVQREKINDMVKFPLTGLDLSEFIIGDTSKSDKNIYDLFAVSNHIGSMGGGHYTAYVKSPNDNCWYEMDDSRTSLVPNEETESRIISPLAYVLFYQRRGTKRAIDTTSNRPQSKI